MAKIDLSNEELSDVCNGLEALASINLRNAKRRDLDVNVQTAYSNAAKRIQDLFIKVRQAR